MKVLLIAPSNDSYGVAESLMTLVLGLKESGLAEPMVLTKKQNKINQRCADAGIENYSFWYADFMAGAAYSNPFMRAIKHVVKYVLYLYGNITKSLVFRCGIDFDKIDIIHTCHNRNDIGAYIAKKKGIPHVWHIREFGEEDYNVKYYKKNCIEYMNQNTDAFIAISRAVADKWKSKGINPSKMHVVYNGVDSDKFSPDYHEKKEPVRVVISSRVQPSKGQLQLVQAVAAMDDCSRKKILVDIIGDAYSDYKALLEVEIKNNHLEDIINLKGHCNNLADIIKSYDVGIVCSKAEAFGRVTAEYMMAGLAVVASDTGANKELLENGVEGLIYQYGDIDELRNKLTCLCHDLDLISQMGIKGRTCAVKKYDMVQYTEKVYDVYNNVIA